jgi:hypothetical protein
MDKTSLSDCFDKTEEDARHQGPELWVNPRHSRGIPPCTLRHRDDDLRSRPQSSQELPAFLIKMGVGHSTRMGEYANWVKPLQCTRFLQKGC